jgi:hypothetical protein
MPTHFNLRGVADGWSPRAFGAWLLPGLAALVWALTRLGAWLLPAGWRERLQSSPVAAVALLTTALLVGLQGIILHVAIRGGGSVNAALGILLGVVWIALGQILPRVRRNPLIGIRTTWTLTSDENWARTHRFAGWTMSAGGLLALVCAAASTPWFMAPILISALVPAGYSFVLARREARAP